MALWNIASETFIKHFRSYKESAMPTTALLQLFCKLYIYSMRLFPNKEQYSSNRFLNKSQQTSEFIRKCKRKKERNIGVKLILYLSTLWAEYSRRHVTQWQEQIYRRNNMFIMEDTTSYCQGSLYAKSLSFFNSLNNKV